MKQWLRKISGLFLASVLTVSLNGRIVAQAEEPAPQDPPPAVSEPAAGESPASAAPSAGGEPEAAAPLTDPAATNPAPEATLKSENETANTDNAGPTDEKAPTDEKTPTDAKTPTDEKTPTDQKAPTDEKTPTDQKAPTDGKTPTDQKTPTDEKAPADEETPANDTPAAADTPVVDDTPLADAAPKTVAAGAPRVKALRSLSLGSVAGDPPASGGEGGETQQEKLFVIQYSEDGVDKLAALEGANPDAGTPRRGEGWSYDVESGSVFLEGYDGTGKCLGTDGCGLTIQNVGLNRIGNLIVDGDLNLVGTGILLVDSLEQANGATINLQTNTKIFSEGTGSVAVFLRQVELDEAGQPTGKTYYELINGSVAGILDESIELPDGVTLKLPDNSSLVLQSVCSDGTNYSTTQYLGPDESSSEAQNHGFGSVPGEDIVTTAPKLTIPQTSALVVSGRAALGFNPISGRKAFWDYDNFEVIWKDVTYAPSLLVQGALELMSNVSRAVVEFAASAEYNGDGVFSDSGITVSGGRETPLNALSIDNSDLTLAGAGANLSALTVDGDSTLHMRSGDSTVGSITMKNGSTLVCRDNQRASWGHTLSVPGGIAAEGSGEATLCLQSGEYRVQSLGPGVKLNSQWDWDWSKIKKAASYNGLNSSGTSAAALFLSGASSLPDNAPHMTLVGTTDVGSFPIYTGQVADIEVWKGSDKEYISAFNTSVTKVKDVQMSEVSSGELMTKAKAEEIAQRQSEKVYVLYVKDDGLCDLKELADSGSVPMNRVRAVYFCNTVPRSHQGSGGTATSTSAVFTGRGSLGVTADSVSGGSPRQLSLSGSGISTSLSQLAGRTDEPSTGPTTDPSTDPTTGPVDADGAGKENGNGQGGESGGAEEGSDAATGLQIWVEPEAAEGVFTLHAAQDGRELKAPEDGVEVSFHYTPEAEKAGKPLYAVFRNKDGSLVAVRAVYDPVTGKLRFLTKRLGRFMILGFDFEGEEFSPDFYAALAGLPELAALS